MNAVSWVLLGLVAALAVGVVVLLVRNRRRGKCACAYCKADCPYRGEKCREKSDGNG